METPPPLPSNTIATQPPPLPPKLPTGSAPSRKATKVGKLVGLSVLGLVLVVVGYVGVRAYDFAQWQKHREPSGADFFSDASDNIGPRGDAAAGNSDLAKAMAADMSKLMLEIRTLGFEQAEKKSLLDKRDQFKTYCELGNDQCVFLIHVPEMRRFSQDAQESLGAHAWKAAQAVIDRKSPSKSEMKLAVGMKGLVSYERVMLGRFVPDGKGTNSGLDKTEFGFGCERSLYKWFEPRPTNPPPKTVSP